MNEEKNKKNIDLLSELIKNIKLKESKFLLNNGIESIKYGLYFASLGIFITFLEKYLRDILIFKEFKINILDENKEGVFLFNKIETEIEEGKREYTFYGICDSLLEKKYLDEELNTKLKDIYKNIRIPVHHGIYKRLVNFQNNNLSMPSKKIEITKDGIISSEVELEQSMLFIREFVIEDVFKYYSFELMDIIIKVLKLEE